MTQLTRAGALRSPLAVCLLVRYVVTLINDDPSGMYACMHTHVYTYIDIH